MQKKEKDIRYQPHKKVVAHYVSEWLPLTQNWIRTQVTGMSDWVPFVLCDSQTGDFRDEDFPVISLWAKSPKLWLVCKSLRKLHLRCSDIVFREKVKKFDPSILHSHFANTACLALPLARRARLKHVVSVYGYDVTRLPVSEPSWKSRYWELFQSADALVAEGPAMAERLRRLQCPTHKIHVIPLGIEFHRLPYRERTLRQSEPLKVLLVGRFVEKKGFRFGLDALAKLCEERPNLQLRVTVVGDGTESRKQDLKDRVRDNGLGEVTTFCGFLDVAELRQKYYEHHVLLSPSVTAADGDAEGGAPVSIIEAAATGLPVVSTYHSDIPYVVREGETGLLAPECDADALADHLMALVDRPGELRRLGQNAANHVRNQHDADRTCRELEALYDNITGQNGD